jgi:ABC-type nitrate/sulfonate/bicarbonate transport system substrate-binding protein
LRFAAFIAVASLTAFTVAPARAADSLSQAFPSKIAAFWPAYVAGAAGFYQKNGLDVSNILTDPNVTVATLIGGSVEVSIADSTQLMLALEKNAPLVAVGLETDHNPYKLMASPGITKIAELKGKKIGVASAIDVYTYAIKEVLRKNGLDPDKDVEFVVGGGQNQRLGALAGGAIQAGLFTPPSDAKLTAQGFTTLAFMPDYFPNLTLSVTTVRRDWAQQHADVLRRFLKAQSDAVKWMYDPANKAQTLKILEDAMNASPSEAQEAYDYYVGKKLFNVNACVTRPGLENVIKIMRITGQLTTLQPSDVPKFTDTQWCPK